MLKKIRKTFIGFNLILAVMLAGCDFFDDDSSVEPLSTGLQTMESNGVERSYYITVPEEEPAIAEEPLKPLIFAFHGSFGSHRSWVGESERYDGFVDTVGDKAIMVMPDALQQSEDNINWNENYDFLFFEDLLAELDRRGLEYDRSRIFLTGHSSGASMTQQLACRYGDIVRGIATSSGRITVGSRCTGSVAVMQTSATNDEYGGTVESFQASATYWALYNGHDPETSQPGVVEPCIDFSGITFPNEPYPVQFCLHSDGHAWTDFNSDGFATFFLGLPDAEPTADHPPGGGNDAAIPPSDTTVTFRLRFPEDIGTVVSGAITLQEPDYGPGVFRSPSFFLNLDWDPNEMAPNRQVVPGAEVLYEQIPISFFNFGEEFDTTKDWQFYVVVYVEGGSRPIPTPYVDYNVLYPLNFVDITTPVVIQETLELEAIIPWR
jgi:poly(3-hydroxybutyrate) depolymerase